MAINYTKIFHSQALQNTPKLVIFGMRICHLATLGSTGGQKVKQIRALMLLIKWRLSASSLERVKKQSEKEKA
jgi:hypothetical protein